MRGRDSSHHEALPDSCGATPRNIWRIIGDFSGCCAAQNAKSAETLSNFGNVSAFLAASAVKFFAN